MPAIAGAAIQAGASILQTFLGGNAAKKAANNYNRVAQAAGQAMYGARDTAVGGVNAATAAGQAGIAGGVNAANETLAGRYNALTQNYNDVTGNVNDLYAGAQGLAQPYVAQGQQSLADLAAATAPGGSLTQQFNYGPGAYQASPGYAFQLQQGQQAIQRAAAARGAGGGAGTAKALAQYTTGLASQDYQNAYNRALQTFQTNRQNLVQNIGMGLGAGQFGTQLGAGLSQAQAGQLGNLALGYGGLQNQVTLPMAGYSYGGGLAGAQLGLQGAESAGQLGLAGTQAANNYYMEGAGAQLGGAGYGVQQQQNMFNSLGNLASSLPWGQWLGGGPASAAQIANINTGLNSTIYNPYSPYSGIGGY